MGMSALHLAAQGDQPAALYYLIHEQNIYVDQTDSKGSSALHWATHSASDTSVNFLLSWGANPNLPEHRHLTPLHLAIR